MAAKKKKKETLAEQIINGTYKESLVTRKESLSEQIIKGTYSPSYDKPYIQSDFDPSPLANVINSTSNKEKEEPKWWQEILQVPDAFNDNLDRFKDGYQFGDITKTVGETVGDTVGTVAGSVADLGLGVVKGVAQTGENLASLAAGGIAQVADWAGNDEYADKLRKSIATSKPPASTWLGQGQDLVDNYSIFGDTGNKTAESVGYMASLWASGGLGKIGQTATMFGSAAGSTLPQSYSKEGVTDAQVWVKALGTGAIETVTERLFGLFGTSGIDKTIANKVSKKITSGAGKILARSGVAATGEAFEEFLSYTGSQGLDLAIDAISNGKGAEFKEDWNWEEVGEQMAIAFLATGALGAGGVGTSVVGNKTNTNTWSDAVNETAKQQDIQALQEDIANLNEKLHKEGKHTINGEKIQAQINERQAELNKLTATDNTAQVQGLQEAIVKKQEELNNAQDPREQQIIQEELNILNEELTEVTNAQQFTNNQQNVDNNAVKERFVYEPDEQTSEYKRAVYESASRVMDNSKGSHIIADFVAKVAEDRGTVYEFTTTAELSQNSEYNIGKGKVINGLVTKDGKVLINIDSKKALETVVGHETIHLLEGTKEYQALQDYVIEYAKQKGIYEEAYRRLEGLYEGKNADINAELTADLVGDLLFSDTNFVKELSVKNRNVFEKLYDYIKHLYKMATAGSKEARQLEQLKYKFEEAYKAEGTKTKGETQLSVSEKDNYSNIANDLISRRNSEDQITDRDIDDWVESTKEFQEAKKQVEYWEENNIDYDDMYLSEKFNEIHDKITKELSKQGYTSRYLEGTSEYIYDQYDNIQKGYDEILDYLQERYRKGELDYEISRSTNAGEVPSIYVTDNDGNQFRIANHYNHQSTLRDQHFNPAYSNNDYINWRETILKDMQDHLNLSSNTKYSISTTDNQGRELTKEQQEFFKDSKVRDENGNLLTVYHGTASDFTIFDEEFAKEGDYGIGFYFTDNKNVAQKSAEISAVNKDISKYMDGTNTGKVMEQYLDIKKPSIWYNYKDINKYKELARQENLNFYDYMRKHYDGIIVTNPRYSNEGNSNAKYYIVFNSNQIKDVDNTKPTTDPDIRYSLSEDTDIDTKINSSMTTDNQGRKLTKEQQEFFKDSKALDKDGNLVTLYHATGSNFDTFDLERAGQNFGGWSQYGKAIYLTSDKEKAKVWASEARIPDVDVKIKEVYGNIKNPFDLGADYNETLSDIKEQYNIDEFVMRKGYRVIEMLDELGLDIAQILTFYGYDGIIDGDQYVVYGENQVKYVDNKQPTDSKNMKYSLSEDTEGNEIAPVKNPNLTYGEDIKYQVEEAIAPLQETIENLTEQVKAMQENIVPTAEQNTQPVSQEVVEQQQQDSMDSLMNEPTPPMSGLTEQEQAELDMFEDFINKNGFEALDKDSQERFRYLIDLKYPDISPETTETKVESPFDSRDIDEVGNRKVKAYQYENPEVRPYFRDEAENMMWDLNNTIKGERSFNDQLYYDSGGEQGFFGTTRQTTEAIAYLKDNYGYSYAQIEKGLNDIIEDNGKENNAVAKRIEFMLDERLREGYTTSDGIPIPPNQEYIKFLEEKQITEYNRENLESLAIDENVPVEENTVVKQPETTVEPELKLSEQVAPQPVKNAQNENTEVTDTSKETKEQEKVAQILSEAPTKRNEKSRLWARFKANFIDKGSVFESLSLKTKNRNLTAKWDNILLSESQAQDVMLNGTREIDAMRKTNKQVSKSLFDIKAEVGDKVQQFSEYLYHKHNINRMSLESNAQARMEELQETTLKGKDSEEIARLSRKRMPTNIDKASRSEQLALELEIQENLIKDAKEYMRLSETKNKPVFGDSVTAEVSQKIVEEFEMNNPEFIDWANDVYDYNRANLNHLVANGVVSQETADQFAELYPNYVPIGRAKNLKNAINVPLDTNKTGINTPIARATGGNSDILPLFDTLANRTIQTYRAAAKNDFGVELKNTLNSTIDTQTTNVEEILDNVDQQENLLQEGKNGLAPTFTVFENGEKVTYEITQDMFDALKPVSEGLKGNILWGVPNKISNFHRGVLTEYNPVFMLTNGIKDFQDILLNSQHASKTYSKIPEAYAQIIGKGYWYQEYMANGGQQNSYFDSQEGSFDTEHKGIYKVLDLPPLKQISQLNNFIELAPRLAEYIASREIGRSKKVSMLDAARITTNFKAGGDITKWANRNGATFLNASVQGAMQQVRNVKEAHANGVKGYANLVAKFTLASVPALILNSLLWGDDDEYEELSDYVKQSYWIVGKYGDGNFIRIPKGRMVTVVQEALNQMTNLVTGNDEADLGQFLEIVGNNIAPTNPIESNILSPILQATSNKTWYGGDLVPTRLQDLPAEEQYDESIDKLSIALGQKLGISPYKINYVLDQYSGGIGDVLLPMLTEEAEGGKDDLMSNILAPLTNKFTVDSTMKNQSVSDFYDLSDELTKKANSSKATEEDVLRNKYVNSIKSEMSELYQQKREIQSGTLPDSEKYEQVRELQDQINSMANAAMTNYDDMVKESNYAEIGGVEYYKNNKNEWVKVNDEKEGADLNAMNMSVSDKNTYFKTKNEINKLIGVVEDSKDSITIEDEDSEEYKDAIKYLNSEKKEDIINKIINTGFTDEQKAYMYKKFYNTDTIDLIVNANISVDDYLTYTTKEFTADYNEKGNAISGSKKEKVFDYINSLEMNIPQKVILFKMEYPKDKDYTGTDYNYDILDYVKELDASYKDKVKILRKVGIEVDDNGDVYW